jgi:diketogulonate reductase-like aldo/keto reductase
MGTDYIDLYQMHRWDPAVDLDETLGALTDLVRAGKVRYIGHSTFPASTIVEAQRTARDRGRERFVTEQPTYSILTRSIENEVLPVCQRYGMGVVPYSPLAGGWLSGRYRKDADQAAPTSVARQRLANRFDMSLPENQRKLDAADQLAQLADEAGLTLIELAIAFVLRHPAITAPIIGPRTMEHLESQLTAADVVLTEDVLDRIDQIVPAGVTLNPADNGWVSPSLQPAGGSRNRPSPRSMRPWRPDTATSTPLPRTSTSKRSARPSTARIWTARRSSSRRRSGSATSATTRPCTPSTRARASSGSIRSIWPTRI